MHVALKIFRCLIKEAFKLLIFLFLFTSETVKFSFMFALVMALDIVFSHNRNRSLADDTNWFTITFNNEIFASPIFFENPTFVTNFPIL
jgi:hypothetical protein